MKRRDESEPDSFLMRLVKSSLNHEFRLNREDVLGRIMNHGVEEGNLDPDTGRQSEPPQQEKGRENIFMCHQFLSTYTELNKREQAESDLDFHRVYLEF